VSVHQTSPPQQLRQETSNCSLLLIYRPRKDERLSWPSWLTNSRWLTHVSGHPSATSRAQDSESTPAKDRCSTAGPRNQPKVRAASTRGGGYGELSGEYKLKSDASWHHSSGASPAGQSIGLIWHRIASPPHTDGSLVFNRLRQCAPQSASAPYRCCPLLSGFEYIDRRTCVASAATRSKKYRVDS